MRVTLAKAYDGHEADETVDLDAATAKRLVNDGRARWPTSIPEPDPPAESDSDPEPEPIPDHANERRSRGKKRSDEA